MLAVNQAFYYGLKTQALLQVAQQTIDRRQLIVNQILLQRAGEHGALADGSGEAVAVRRTQRHRARRSDGMAAVAAGIRTTQRHSQFREQASLGLNLAQSRYNLGLGSIVELGRAELQQTEADITDTDAQYQYRVTQLVLAYKSQSA